FADLETSQLRLALYEELSNQQPAPFQWKFDRAKLSAWLAKIEARQMAQAEAQLTCLAEAAKPGHHFGKRALCPIGRRNRTYEGRPPQRRGRGESATRRHHVHRHRRL